MLVWDLYDRFRVSPRVTSEIRHSDVISMLESLRARHPDSMSETDLGVSVEGRQIKLVTLGSGTKKVFAWSQMHGNEPTHTAVLLDLISFLQNDPEEPLTKEILSNCTLYLIPMLNPDGAERYIRRNAQGIDINRDAQQLQTPEGRLLRKAVEEIQPDFALNLHNQSPRRSVGSDPPRVAAVSLLVPPVDANETQTEGVRQAKQLAACFLDAVRQHCPGMISRYDADYMPRCFGEWVQQQGATTLTIEAGGWTTPSIASSPLVPIHLVGLTSLLHNISTEDYLKNAPTVYDALPRSNEHDLFDLLIRNATLLGRTQQTFSTDIGVNFTSPNPTDGQPRQGVISDLGDLSVTTAKTVIDATSLIFLPGRIVCDADVSPTHLPGKQRVDEVLSQGVTTIVGKVDISQSDQLDAIEDLRSFVPLPVHLGFVADLSQIESMSRFELEEAFQRAVELGILGYSPSSSGSNTPSSTSLPDLFNHRLSQTAHRPTTLSDCVSGTAEVARCLSLSRREPLTIGNSADLIAWRLPEGQSEDFALDWKNLQQVIVAGNVVWQDGEAVADLGGELLMNRSLN